MNNRSLVVELFFAGATEDLPRYQLISVVVANAMLYAVFVLSACWAILSFALLGSGALAAYEMAACIVALLLSLLIRVVGFSRLKHLIVLFTFSYYASVNIACGFGTGVEFYLGPIVGASLLVLAEASSRVFVINLVGLLLLGALNFVAMGYVEPVLQIDPEAHHRGYLASIFFVTAAVLALFRAYQFQASAMLGELEGESERSQLLLKAVLPTAIAARISGGENRIADSHAGVSVLFADLQGFTSMSSKLAPLQLVDTLDDIYSRIDELATEFRIEKIKTIGDCYMAAGGVFDAEHDPADMVEFALKIISLVRSYGEQIGYPLSVRIGIGYGQVVSGVIGRSRKTFDLWGETVNLASRMESTGEANRIQVTESLYWRLKNVYRFERRESVSVKGVGDIDTYVLVEG